ncbi:hypothetical protein B0T25DRAFT_553248 [Lasiosphaeria hispida]|uniref:Uncharacterized protein n=1 Tax=Lasiosphaeria hispida TaxID=260671 RepID=A0AAJ0HCA3_9PEZI|nr:hypothetical protein B0T25DRAFT_553248 [Lasiosphaeria hispida]
MLGRRCELERKRGGRKNACPVQTNYSQPAVRYRWGGLALLGHASLWLANLAGENEGGRKPPHRPFFQNLTRRLGNHRGSVGPGTARPEREPFPFAALPLPVCRLVVRYLTLPLKWIPPRLIELILKGKGCVPDTTGVLGLERSFLISGQAPRPRRQTYPQSLGVAFGSPSTPPKS